jgi:hypothetical protein
MVALASAGAIRVHSLEKVENFENGKSDAVAEATGFDGFGGFGGFRGFHQFNGLMSNAFGDLEGQFDTTGFNKEESQPLHNHTVNFTPPFLILFNAYCTIKTF